MMDILKLSCAEDMDFTTNDTKEIPNAYLERGKETSDPKVVVSMSKDEQTARVKEYFSKLVAEGMDINNAAAQAINKVAEEMDRGINVKKVGNLRGTKVTTPQKVQRELPCREKLRILEIVKRYFENVQKNPISSKFRNFKLSNKVFDGITSTEGGLEYVIKDLGLRVRSTDTDFVASIPLGVNIDALCNRIDDLMQRL